MITAVLVRLFALGPVFSLSRFSRWWRGLNCSCSKAWFPYERLRAPVRGAERSYARLMFSFACQKRTRKAPATFEAREPTGCGSQRLLRYRSHPAGRCPNSSSLYPPQAAVVAVARKGLLAPFRPQRSCRNGKKLAASLNAFFSFLRFAASQLVLPLC